MATQESSGFPFYAQPASFLFLYVSHFGIPRLVHSPP
jgi:hypothetical protein